MVEEARAVGLDGELEVAILEAVREHLIVRRLGLVERGDPHHPPEFAARHQPQHNLADDAEQAVATYDPCE